MHCPPPPTPPGCVPHGGRSGVGGLCVSPVVGTGWYRSARVLLTGQGCENLPEDTQGERLDFRVTAKQALAPPPSVRNHPRGRRCPEAMDMAESFGLRSFCLRPLKNPTPATRENARAPKRRPEPRVPQAPLPGAGWGNPGCKPASLGTGRSVTGKPR